MYYQCYYPSQQCGIAGRKGCPFPATRFLSDSGQGRDAGEIYQYEQHVSVGHQRGNRNAVGQIDTLYFFLIRIEYSQCTYTSSLAPMPERIPIPIFQSKPSGSMAGSMAFPICPM